ncbi:MAG: DUF711 family protein [Acidobacteriia bacterium]|nr:DUF711 family protein [Terriglobia bacterium]
MKAMTSVLLSARRRVLTLGAFLALALPAALPSPAGAQAPAAGYAEKPKIRALTAFVNLDRATYRAQIDDALLFLRSAKRFLETTGGYEVQSIRISTQPFPQYTQGLTTEQTVAFFKEYDALAGRENFAASIGPAMLNPDSSPAEAVLVAEILRNTKHLNASVVVAGEDGVRWAAVGAAARVIKTLSLTTERSQGNFNFSAIAMVPPLTPFYPGSYHTGFGHQFAIALQSANVAAEAFRGAPDIATAQQRLTAALYAHAAAIEALAGRVDSNTGWAYVGMDLSPAPLKEVSIAAAIENLIAQPVGSSGTLTAAATITAALRNITVKRTGYSGLMLPVLEDSLLAARWSDGQISLDSLLSYSAVCGTGLDTIPLPGDVTEDQLALMIADVASLAFKWNKPLSARLLPVAGKQAGQKTEFDDPHLVNVTLRPLRAPVSRP